MTSANLIMPDMPTALPAGLPADSPASGGRAPLQVLTLELGGETFAFDAGVVQEILDMVPVTAVPGSDPFVNGLINVRGKVVPVADLRQKFAIEPAESTIDARIVVIEIPVGGDSTTVGVRADRVHEVTEIALGDLTETPSLGLNWPPELIRCIGKYRNDFIAVLNIERIFWDDAEDIASPSGASQDDRRPGPIAALTR